jgi:hypothetical protein
VTSERKIRANRANARASTGPKTVRGRSRAARNALRHALSLSVYSDPALSEEVETLAQKIVATDANAEKQELAHRIAEAQIDLRANLPFEPSMRRTLPNDELSYASSVVGLFSYKDIAR